MYAEDRAALLDARIAALKTGLNLTLEQENNWAPLEDAIRANAKARAGASPNGGKIEASATSGAT